MTYMISRKMDEKVFTLEDGEDIDFASLELQYSDLSLQLDKDKKEDTIITEINNKYEDIEKQS